MTNDRWRAVRSCKHFRFDNEVSSSDSEAVSEPTPCNRKPRRFQTPRYKLISLKALKAGQQQEEPKSPRTPTLLRSVLLGQAGEDTFPKDKVPTTATELSHDPKVEHSLVHQGTTIKENEAAPEGVVEVSQETLVSYCAKKSKEYLRIVQRTAADLLLYSQQLYWPQPEREGVVVWIHFRVLLLTLYCCVHYCLLVSGVWSSWHITRLPKPPSVEQLQPAPDADGALLSKFVGAVHPHVDGHPHLHVPIAVAMQRCLGFAAVEWILMLWLSSASIKSRSRVFGLIVTVLTLRNVAGTLFGGLDHKAVFFFDLWGFILRRLRANYASLGSCQPITVKRTIQVLRHFFKLMSCHVKAPLHVKRQLLRFSVISMLMFVCLMDIGGFALSCCCIYLFLSPSYLTGFIGVIAIVLGIGQHFLASVPRPDAGDSHWLDFSRGQGIFYSSTNNAISQTTYFSKYIEMKDGVKIAADVYLPSSTVLSVLSQMKSNDYRNFYRSTLQVSAEEQHSIWRNVSTIRVPTMLTMTRYNRRMVVRWPFSMLSLWGQGMGQSTTNVWNWQVVDALVPNGYALVVVDVRGTGASTGFRPVDFSLEEVGDYKTIYEWVTNQFWYDGHVASGGFSYDGMTGLHLASQVPLDAVLALFTPMDVVHDLIQPGGIVCTSFVEDYTGLTNAFERKGTPVHHMITNYGYEWQLILGFLLTFGTAAPVKGEEAVLAHALEDHQQNWNMAAMVDELHFSDDFVVLPGSPPTRVLVGRFGIQRDVIDNVLKNQAAIYIVGGYFDSSSVKGAGRLFETLRIQDSTPNKHQLILGPWTHTGRRTCSPYSKGTNSHFEADMYLDIIRFLDCRLKKRCWTLPLRSVRTDEDPNYIKAAPVHFWSVGEERWLSSFQFPPLGVREISLPFTSEHVSLTREVANVLRSPLKRDPKSKAFWSPREKGESRNSYQLGGLSRKGGSESHIIYHVDYSAATRGLSRWAIAKHPFRMAVDTYRQLIPQARKHSGKPNHNVISALVSMSDQSTGNVLMFTTPPLRKNVRVVGSPVVRFALNLTDEFRHRAAEIRKQFTYKAPALRLNQAAPLPGLDVTVFGYIEDIDPATGQVHYVSEGRVLLSHRPTLAYGAETSRGLENWEFCAVPPFKTDKNFQTPGLKQEPRTGSPDVIYQIGTQAHQQFSFGGVECVVFTFEPFVWLFRKGHLLRLSLAGADLANFRWEKTQVKEDADLLARSLLSQMGVTDRLGDLRQRHVHVERPLIWNIPITENPIGGFLKLPIWETSHDLTEALVE